MKWVTLLVMLATLPIAISLMRSNPRYMHWVGAIMGAALFVYSPWHVFVTPLPWPMWAGYVKGIQFTIVDVLALSVILSGTARSYSVILKWLMALYFLTVTVAVLQSPVPIASSLYLLQLMRMFTVFYAVALLAQNDRSRDYLISGLIVGLGFQALMAGWGRAHGMPQSGGTIGHQNMLGMLTNLILMPAIAMLLSRVRIKWAIAGIGFAALALVCTASRASIGIGGGGVLVTLLLCLLRRPTSRKAGIAAGAVLALAVVSPFAIKSLSNRFQGGGVEFSLNSEDVRTKMEHAAEMMIDDHPLGVGPNYFVVAANKGGYWRKVGVPVTRGNMGAHVHNSYLLVEAETGVAGLFAICLLFIGAMIYALRTAFKFKYDVRGDLLVSLFVSLGTFAAHNTVEWGIVNENIQYFIMVVFGLIAGLVQRIRIGAAGHRKSVMQSTTHDDAHPRHVPVVA